MLKTSFGSVMSRDRFSLIWRYLHLQNRQDPPPQTPDRLLKVRWFIDFLNDKFAAHYTPYGDVTIDESMVRFKGRLAFRQYLPAKPIKWGIKIWTLAESFTGYMLKFQIYTGKEDNEGKGLAHRVVLDLMEGLQDTNVRLFMDNFYTGVDLLKNLSMRGINACGTVRTNRKGLPTDMLPKNMKVPKHEYRVAQNDNLTFCHWQDTKPVLAISNFHDPEDTGLLNRRGGGRQQRQVRVPKMLSDYQDNMKGVDLCDQMLGYYMINHKSHKWWRRLFFYFMMASVHNAYIIAKDVDPVFIKKEYPNFQEFVEEVAEGLIGDVRTKRDAPQGGDARPARRHDMEKMFDKPKVCVECRATAARGARVGTSHFGCVQCATAIHQGCLSKHITRVNNGQ